MTLAAPALTLEQSDAFARSLDALTSWLDTLAVRARDGERPVPPDVVEFEDLLSRVWTAGGRGNRPGLPRGSAEQRRFLDVIGPAFRESECLRHAMAKPHGYPGDFEMMQKVYDNVPAGSGPRGRWLDAWLLGLPYSQAVRNRAALIMGLLAETWLAGGRRVANIASGCAAELAAVHGFLPFDSITLLDQDAVALGAATAAIRAREQTTVLPLAHTIRDLVTGRCEVEPGQDFVYSIGLYDYLSTGTAAALTGRLWAAVAPGGCLAIGNFAAGEHPNKHILEGALDWYLHYRSPAELLDLAAELPHLDAVRVHTDPTGSLHLIIARRGSYPG